MLFLNHTFTKVDDLIAQDAFFFFCCEYIGGGNIGHAMKLMDGFIYDFIKNQTDIINREDHFNLFNQHRKVALALAKNFIDEQSVIINGLHKTFKIKCSVISGFNDDIVTFKIIMEKYRGKKKHKGYIEPKSSDEFLVQETRHSKVHGDALRSEGEVGV